MERISVQLSEKPETSINEMAVWIRDELGLELSRSKVYRTMKELANPFKKVGCQKISDANIEVRNIWAHRMIRDIAAFQFPTRRRLAQPTQPLNIGDIWFQDEKFFRLTQKYSPQNNRVWCAKGATRKKILKGPKGDMLRTTRDQRSSNSGVMVSLAVNAVHGFVPVYVVPEGVKIVADSFIDVLDNHFLPYILSLTGGGFVWQMDNAPAHVARTTKEYLRNHWVVPHEVRLLPWPANSPDMQPLDYCFWKLIQDKVGNTDSKAVLTAQIMMAVHEINREWPKHQHIITREFPRRLRLLRGSEGGHFEGDDEDVE